MRIDIKNSVTLSATGTSVTLDNLKELVDAAIEAGISLETSVHVHISHGDRPFESDTMTITVG